jgi:3-deoxy-alpha-D-manno-octulosonate 8-oxidase
MEIFNVKKIYKGKNIFFKIIEEKLKYKKNILLIDFFFKNKMKFFKNYKKNLIIFLNTSEEPSTDSINNLINFIKKKGFEKPQQIIAIGGGSTLDSGKAISNLLKNNGNAEKYQGWDLLKKPGVYKIGVPTIFGTGAEASKTCVLMNKKKNLKLGMNSKYSVFDEIIIDPSLSKTVPKNQFFYTAMDSYIHSFESLRGKFKNGLSNSLATESKKLVMEVFFSNNLKSADSLEKLSVASYLGGSAIGMSMVGLVHPLSASLSVVFNIKHCIGNCIVMRAMKKYYPADYKVFWKVAKKQKITIPKLNIVLNEDILDRLINSTLVHSKPLKNALGKNYKSILSKREMKKIYSLM